MVKIILALIAGSTIQYVASCAAQCYVASKEAKGAKGADKTATNKAAA